MNNTLEVLKRITLLLVLVVSAGFSFAQMVTENILTVEEYVETVLLGEGVSVQNITYNGLPANQVQPRVGYFNGQNSDFYFDEGLVMTTKNVNIVTCGLGGDGSGLGADPDLNALVTGNLNDVTIIEFDFIPQGDTLSFEYIFASREYNGFVCSGFNDVFGFFLSGPGVNGPFTNNAINIAVLPDGTPVTINNVNNGANGQGAPCNPPGGATACPCNAEFFTNNGSGNGTGLHSDLCFGGYTTPLVAEAIVQCGETYHIKLALANVLDGALDSGVFLQAGSFASSAAIVIDLEIDSGINDSTLVEGCGGATLIFQRQLDLVEQTIYLSTAGDAINGVDFTEIPDSLVFPVGVTEITFYIEAFHDNLIEGLETVELIVENENVCGGENLQTSSFFYIDEYDPLEVSSYDGFIDCGEPIDLIPEFIGGSPPLSFQWSTGETTAAITVNPLVSATYELTVTDFCGLYEETVAFFVEVPVYDELTVNIGPDWSLTCITPVLIEPQINGGSGDFVYEWLNNGQFSQDDLTWNTLPDGDGILTFTVTDHCGNTATDQLSYETPPVEVSVNLGDDYFVSCIDNTPIPSFYSGGVGVYSFDWLVNGQPYSDLPSIQFQSLISSELILTVTDECGNFNSDTVIVNVPNIPLELEISTDTTICIGDQAMLTAIASGGEGGFSYQWFPTGDTVPTIFVTPEDTTSYFLIAEDICGISIGDSVSVFPTGVHAEFELDYVGTNGVSFTNLSTPDVDYLWSFGDGFRSRLFEPVHEYFFMSNYYISLYVSDSLGCSDLYSLPYNPPMFLYIPNSFTPNGDGINELFKAEGVGVKSFELTIWNRQGEQLFHTTDITEGWNGSAAGSGYFVPDGVYVYRYKAESADGQKIEDRGHITVVR
jgi:gliding motility-associated-like protein